MLFHQPFMQNAHKLNIAFSINTFADELSATSLIASLKFFFWGPGMAFISELNKLFELNS